MALPGHLHDQTLLFANAQQINMKPCTQNLIEDLTQLLDGYPTAPMYNTWWNKRQACIVLGLHHGGRKRRKTKRRKKRRKRTYRRRRASRVRKARRTRRRTRRRIRRRRRRRGGSDLCNAGYTGTLNKVGQLNCQELSQEPQA